MNLDRALRLETPEAFCHAVAQQMDGWLTQHYAIHAKRKARNPAYTIGFRRAFRRLVNRHMARLRASDDQGVATGTWQIPCGLTAQEAWATLMDAMDNGEPSLPAPPDRKVAIVPVVHYVTPVEPLPQPAKPKLSLTARLGMALGSIFVSVSDAMERLVALGWVRPTLRSAPAIAVKLSHIRYNYEIIVAEMELAEERRRMAEIKKAERRAARLKRKNAASYPRRPKPARRQAEPDTVVLPMAKNTGLTPPTVHSLAEVIHAPYFAVDDENRHSIVYRLTGRKDRQRRGVLLSRPAISAQFKVFEAEVRQFGYATARERLLERHDAKLAERAA